MLFKPPINSATEKALTWLQIILAVIVLATTSWLFSSRGLYLGYLIAALLAVAAILDGYVHIGRRRLQRQLAHIERLERQEARAHDEPA